MRVRVLDHKSRKEFISLRQAPQNTRGGKMDFRVWAEEYLKTADMLNECIDEMKKRRKKTFGDEGAILERKIYTLRVMRGDCVSTAEILRKKAERLEEGSIW